MASNRPAFLSQSDPEFFAELIEILSRGVIRWEIFYADGSQVFGTSVPEWVQAPSDEVQVVIWQDTTQQVTVISQLDDYLGKTGTWMEDVDFDALLALAPTLSRIT